jgi:hypothetical protein
MARAISGKLTIRLLGALIVPIVVLLAGGRFVLVESGRQAIDDGLRPVPGCDVTPLEQRLHYGANDVACYWQAIHEHGRAVDRRYLNADLCFPFVYGVALAGALLAVRAQLRRRFHEAWAIVPVAIVMMADWTENLVQLGQLARFQAGGAEALQSTWIAVASAATMLKVVLGCGLLLGLLILAGVAVRSHRSIE